MLRSFLTIQQKHFSTKGFLFVSAPKPALGLVKLHVYFFAKHFVIKIYKQFNKQFNNLNNLMIRKISITDLLPRTSRT